MPFSPLPGTFLDDLARESKRGVLELGCGDGRLTRMLRALGAEVVTLDMRPPRRGSVAMIVGDALAPPLRDGTFGMVVAANLVRHIWRRLERRPGPDAWRRLLAPGGCLYVFEDEPVEAPPAARHYRDLQNLLAGVPGLGRGPLLPQAEFTARRRRWGWSGQWRQGSLENVWPVDAGKVLAFLGDGPRDAGGKADRLHAAIARDGLAYGSYWWGRWSEEAAGA